MKAKFMVREKKKKKKKWNKTSMQINLIGFIWWYGLIALVILKKNQLVEQLPYIFKVRSVKINSWFEINLVFGGIPLI